MANNTLTLFCVVDGEPGVFLVEITDNRTVTHLKDAIKIKKSPEFDDIAADKLILWKNVKFDLGQLQANEKKILDEPMSEISDSFGQEKPEKPAKMISIIAERPSSERRNHDWKEYQAKDGPIDLPPALINLLNTTEFTPAPREEFKRHLDNKHAGDQTTLPSLGQDPSTMEKATKESLFSSPSRWKACGWIFQQTVKPGQLDKYASDSLPSTNILTTTDLKQMVFGSPTDGQLATFVTGIILGYTLCRKDLKTLFIIDEHGGLFKNKISEPYIFTPLLQLTLWPQDRNGARVVITGTAHAHYERRYITSDFAHWVEFVTPLSDSIFDKLLVLIWKTTSFWKHSTDSTKAESSNFTETPELTSMDLKSLKDSHRKALSTMFSAKKRWYPERRRSYQLVFKQQEGYLGDNRKNPGLLHLCTEHVDVLADPPSEVIENTLLQCYAFYPRFDFIYNRTFIQVSVSEFTKHNEQGADITKAFLRPEDPQSKSTDSSEPSGKEKK
ncbi:hypothetical protein BGZ65_004323 [Modicella reniformis]|uniref:Crinkler effector protein N-terminal domain-containing protein n=1 Tax=Modicella reniformis TaxID=1440133 RepID=A0A9P6MKQ2_9FUNG|nr:hypothetical protein BGZ65_004323 [Modicella reniformis]